MCASPGLPTPQHSAAGSTGRALPGVQSQEESEVGVGLDDSGLPIHSATLIEVQLPAGLQHRVQPVQHCRVAKVGAVQ